MRNYLLIMCTLKKHSKKGATKMGCGRGYYREKPEKLGVGSGLLLIIAVSIIFAAIVLIFCPAISINFFGSSVMLEVYIIIIVGLLAAMFSEKEDIGFIVAGIFFLVFFVIDVIILLSSSSIFQDGKLYNQLGNGNAENIKEVEFGEMISQIDTSQIPIVDYETAKILATQKLGEDVTLGSRCEVGDGACMEVAGEVMYVFPLEHSGFFKWRRFQTTPGFITVSASNASQTKYHGGYSLRYMINAYFGDNLDRHLRMNGCLSDGLTERTFELKDDLTPMIVTTTYKNEAGWGIPEPTGVAICDPQTGKVEKYKIGEVPDWVDVVYPDKFIANQINNWGQYSHGWWNPAKEEIFQKTSGILTVFDHGDCYYFTGLTSQGSDRSVGGFVMVNTRTKEVKQAKLSGITEDSAKSDAKALWSDYGYEPTNPMPINVNGVPTYAFAFKSPESRLIVAYGMMNVSDNNIKARGESLKEAAKAYAKKLATSGSTYAASDEAFVKKVEGKIFRISDYVEGGDTYYTFLIEGHDEIFVATNQISEEIPLTEPGDYVTISYVDDGNGTFSVDEFDNTAYQISKSENQMHRDELDETYSTPTDNLVEVDPQSQESWWESLSDEEKAKIMNGEAK